MSSQLHPAHRDEDESLLISSLISQLRVGMGLSKVTFPTFVLDPRSILERITYFMAHPDLIFGADRYEDPEERFIRWRIKPKDFFRCRYDYPNGTQGFYNAEQVSHHPPIFAFYYVSLRTRSSSSANSGQSPSSSATQSRRRWRVRAACR
ncbi:hypothetical protein BC826DRAFT_1014737 [Russula brevipes]|nr:hypothetical protein BC826DRAFT_1014737 [Russula brevipes]